jgi:DNA (cytosine-5)-methyltransferase 1
MLKKQSQQLRRSRFTAIDLFCGCGGITQGLKGSCFKVVAAVDNDPVACKTYRANHPNVVLYRDDIRNIDPLEVRSNALQNKDLDLLVVCAPCQPFSSQNRLRKGDDSRYYLILESIKFAKVLKPKVIFFENVPGLGQHKQVLKKLEDSLSNLDYNLSEPRLVDAADYAVPQRRLRCILIATLASHPPELPRPQTPQGRRKTVRDAIYSLSRLNSGEIDAHDPLHQARDHRPIALERLRHIPKNGGSRASLPPELVLNCHREHDGHCDVYGRMHWDKVAPTLTTGCTDFSRGRFAHPEDDRAITLREAALLQSFPRNYKFTGNRGQIEQQIGNAVPVNLARAFIPSFRQAIINSMKEVESSNI